MDKLGPTKLVEVAHWVERTIPVSQILDEVGARLTSDTWMIPEEVITRLMPSLREWAQGEFGGLEYQVTEEEEYIWMVLWKE